MNNLNKTHSTLSATQRLLKTGLLMLSLTATSVLAANECKIQYQYKNDSGSRVYKKYLSLNSGQTKWVNANHLDYVKNLKRRDVKIWVGNYSQTLKHNAIDPFPGFHLADVKFKKVKCLSNNSATPIEQIIRVMKQQGKNAEFVARHLKNVFNQTAAQTGQWLKAIGYSAQQVARAMHQVFNYSATQVAQLLKSTFQLGERAIAESLKFAQFTINETAKALKTVARVSAATAMRILSDVYGGARGAICGALDAAGYAASQIASAAKSVWNSTAQQVSVIFKNTLKMAAKETGKALRAAGYSARQIANAIQSSYDYTAKQTRSLLRQVGYTARQAEQAVKRYSRGTQPQCPKGKKLVLGRCI